MVTIPPREFSLDEKREHVLAYVTAAHGKKAAYLQEQGLTPNEMRQWRMSLADGDLGVGLVPRHTGTMARDDVAEIRRLQAEVKRLQAERDQARGDLDRMRKATDALGKAIDVMQSVHGVDSDEDARS
ncbi:MAG: hypothetical protein ACRDGQ_08970 [Candidatus Limnocylindrales bacterium]